MNKVKLPRVNKSLSYTTGDAQTWTYQYTWEDWAAVNDDPSSYWCTDYVALYLYLLDYFTTYPEYVQEHKDFKDYTLDQIRVYMQNLKFNSTYFNTAKYVNDLTKLWNDMLIGVNLNGGV